MRISEMDRSRRSLSVRRRVRIEAVLLLSVVTVVPPCLALQTTAPVRFVIVGSRFHQRDQDDAGEVRVCLQNTSEASLSMTQLNVQVIARVPDNPDAAGAQQKCVYVKLSPPVLQPGQCGELVAKPFDRLARGRALVCTVSAADGATAQTVALTEPNMWISYIGFSEDLREIFVYVENTGHEMIEAKLLRVGSFDAGERARTIHCPVPPGDKGCLACRLPSPVSAGDFVHVVVAAKVGTGESKIHTVVRAINAMPVFMESNAFDPRWSLDARNPFAQVMVCPAHAHGPHEAAAAEFLADYVQRFSQDSGQVIQMHICRSDFPRAWFRFGSLPDVAVMNTCLHPPSRYDANQPEWFCPFSRVGDLAKRATEPGRFLALIPTGPDADEEGAFLLKGLTSQEWRFLVYCAIASGAKGVEYRGSPADDPLSRDAFGQVNKELQHLKPLLLIAEPVDWVTTTENGYAAKGLLCGDQAILVMVFNCRYFSQQRNGRFYTPPFGREVKSVKVNVKTPQETIVGQVRSLSDSLDRESWTHQADHLDFIMDMIDSVQVYVVDLLRRAKPSEAGVLTP